MNALGLRELVANGTMSAEMAATLAVGAGESRSMLFVAIPRMAGKSTVMRAALQHAPMEAALHSLSRALGPELGIPERGDGGYLVVNEISPAGFDDYLWGADVLRVFAALERGFSLATALHAGGIEEAFGVIQALGVSDDQASRIDLVTYIRSIGYWRHPLRRVVESIHEVSAVTGGRVEARLLHRWSEREDQFEAVERPNRVGGDGSSLELARARFAGA